MTDAAKPFYFIRQIGTQNYEGGYGMNAVPKLYTKGSAFSVVGKKNKDADRQDDISRRIAEERTSGGGSFAKWPRYEAVPVTITIGEPS
jgi:hypothetical protein